MRRLVVGTGNPKKLAEIRALLTDLPVEVVSVDEVAPGTPSPEETGSTFMENAELKALFFAARTGALCLADDSGLEIEALDGAPGLRSARWSGADGDDASNNAKLEREMRGVAAARRGAGYRCALAVAAPGKVLLRIEESCRGTILETPRGEGGFGYDPWFLPAGADRSFAEMDPESKAALSHRGRALRKLRRSLPAVLTIVDDAQSW